MPAATEGQKVCLHCGTNFRPTAVRLEFCCAGCQFVHDLIRKNGLGQYYDLQDAGVQPVKSLVFQKRDYSWLEQLVTEAEKQPVASLSLDLQGLSCIGCAWLVERLFTRKPGALAIRVDPTMGTLDLRWKPGALDLVEFAREIQSYGYLVGQAGDKAGKGADRGLLIRLGICAALTMNTMLFTLPSYLGMLPNAQFADLFQRLSLVLGTLSILIGGSYFFTRSLRSLRAGVLHIDLPISIGLLAAYFGSLFAASAGARQFVYFDFVSTFTFLMLVGRWLQQKAVERNRAQLLASQAEPSPVHSLDGNTLPVVELTPGAHFLCEPGQVIPVRGRLESDAGVFGTEWINGESEAIVARRGRTIPAGATNCGPTAVELEAQEPWADSLLAKLLRVSPTGAERNIALERFIRGYIYVVLAIAALGAVGWWVMTGSTLAAIQVAISILVVSCPCASGVALPLAADLAASRLRPLGVFVRNTEIWQKLMGVKRIVFDKTGTLTLETISLLNPQVLASLESHEKEILLAIVNDSLHPVSGCLREQLLADGIAPSLDVVPTEVIGFGLEADLGSGRWRLGRPGWAGGELGDCIFSVDGEPRSIFYFGEEPRADAVAEVAALQKRGCPVFILSGDRQSKVEQMGVKLGLPADQCWGEMSPEEKGDWVARFDQQDTLFIGDGANDSLAFDAAWCTGTPAVDRGLLEQKADFYFLGRGLSGVRALLDMAARRRRAAYAVVGFALAYNTFAVTLCLFGKMSPLLAAVLMPASSLVSLMIVYTALRKQCRSSAL